MDANRQAPFRCKLAQGLEVADMAVDAAIRDEPSQMQAAAAFQDFGEKIIENRIFGKAAVLKGNVDAGHVLVNNSARAYIEVPDFRIAHIAFWQAYRAAGSLQPGIWP